VGQARLWLLWSSVGALLLALGAGLLVARSLQRPVLAMTAAAQRMTGGDFAAQLPPHRGDELADLGQALDHLRQQLAGRIADLRDEGEKLRTILNGMTEGVALVQGGVFVVANPAFKQLLGAQAEVLGRTPLEAVRLPELADVVSSAGRARHSAERDVQVASRALRLKGQPLGAPSSDQAVVMILDMTEARRLERLRREFVANASHELRTPVAAIVGVAETLEAGAAEDPEARQSFLAILIRHAQRLSRLTSDLLDIARLEAGYQPRPEEVPVREVVQTVVQTLQARAEAKHLRLEAKLEGDAVVSAERAAVEQILTNLVDNAIKYTAEGGEVTIRSAQKGTSVELCVEDTGAGIPSEHLPRLFDRFYRVDNARSRELGGTGLGLAIVKHLALANAGAVRVDSRPGKGSRFFVTLPRP
jgi:two-component system phosphate regulon sensor histidine kinase PhoR